jgi:hypothetical protein
MSIGPYSTSSSGVSLIDERAPLKHSRRCLKNHTRTGSSMSETPDEEVEYGPIDIDANLNTDTDHARSTPENDSQD